MLRVTPLPAFQDNYIWAIHAPIKNSLGQTPVIVVDPGDANVVTKAITQKNWSLAAILITHHHHDHVGGLIELKEKYKVPVYGPMNESIEGIDFALVEGDVIEIDDTNLSFSVLDVPGHTLDHIAYLNESDQDNANSARSLFCGDTLFSAGCGRMFEGTPEQFSSSLNKFAKLPTDTIIYCTHEYTSSNLRFAAHVDPSNLDIQQYQAYVKEQRIKDKPTVPTTLDLELKINPFLNCSKPLIQKRIADLSELPHAKLLNNSVQTFAQMRSLKDNF